MDLVCTSSVVKEQLQKENDVNTNANKLSGCNIKDDVNFLRISEQRDCDMS